jgi:type IV secretion system protein VirD4
MASTHGSARLAQSIKDVEKEPWNAPHGILLGRMVESRGLLRKRVETRNIRLAQDTHHLCVGAAGAGKYVSSVGVILRDLLLTDNAGGSCLIVDPKGEALKLIGKMGLRPFGLPDAPSRYDIAWLDPFNVMGADTWSLNPITRLGPGNPNASADARLLAQALVVVHQGQGSHWDETARNFYTALLVYVAQYPGLNEPRDLLTLHRLLSLAFDYENATGESLEKLCAEMAKWTSGPKAVMTGANAVLELPNETRQSFLMSARRDSAWMADGPMERVLRGGNKELDPEEIALKRMMVFLVIPDVYAETHKTWLRTMISSVAFYLRLHQPQEKTWATRRHIFVDEWPNLGKLEVSQQGVVVMRGANCMWHLYCQDFARPKEIYGAGWEGFFGSSMVQAFGVNDNTTLDYLSKRMGRATVSTLQERDDGSGGRNWSEAGRPLMTPDEIATLTGADSNQQLLLRGGSDPVLCSRYHVYWWEDYKRVNPTKDTERFTLREVYDTVNLRNPSPGDLQRFAWWRPV